MRKCGVMLAVRVAYDRKQFVHRLNQSSLIYSTQLKIQQLEIVFTFK